MGTSWAVHRRHTHSRSPLSNLSRTSICTTQNIDLKILTRVLNLGTKQNYVTRVVVNHCMMVLQYESSHEGGRCGVWKPGTAKCYNATTRTNRHTNGGGRCGVWKPGTAWKTSRTQKKQTSRKINRDFLHWCGELEIDWKRERVVNNKSWLQQ